MSTDRIDRLTKVMASSGFDAVALTPGSSLTYLTGLHFHLMERPTVLLVSTSAPPALILAELEVGKAKEGQIPLQTFPFGENPAHWSQAFDQAVKALKLDGKRIGVESAQMRFLELRFLEQAAPNAHFDQADEVLGGLRMKKDEEEIAAMRRAVQIAQEALTATLPMIKSGVTEREIAGELLLHLLRAGSETDVPFMPIVASGPNSANPHAVPTERAVQPGDLLVIDWGARFNGYCSDLTRTFAIGSVDPELEHIAELVNQANAAGRAASRPGVAAGEVDRAARAVIDAGGYGAAFFHRTGHGLGMEEHEPPYLFGENTLTLTPGMTFTVEPGIYLSGRGGVRIEDNMAITADGAETLSDMPRNLIQLGG